MVEFDDSALDALGFDNRALHVVDIENLLGDVDPIQPKDVARCAAVYERFVETGDKVVVGWSFQPREEVQQAWQGPVHVWRRGEDGADRRLVLELRQRRHQIKDSFRRGVFVASGDAEFVGIVRDLVTDGVHVTVVSREESLAQKLGQVASAVKALPWGSPVTEPPAREKRHQAAFKQDQAKLAAARALYTETRARIAARRPSADSAPWAPLHLWTLTAVLFTVAAAVNGIGLAAWLNAGLLAAGAGLLAVMWVQAEPPDLELPHHNPRARELTLYRAFTAWLSEDFDAQQRRSRSRRRTSTVFAVVAVASTLLSAASVLLEL